MGVLDDAIREHLELKRRHGATEDEIARKEAEALGPARRGPAAEPAEPEAGEPAAADLTEHGMDAGDLGDAELATPTDPYETAEPPLDEAEPAAAAEVEAATGPSMADAAAALGESAPPEPVAPAEPAAAPEPDLPVADTEPVPAGEEPGPAPVEPTIDVPAEVEPPAAIEPAASGETVEAAHPPVHDVDRDPLEPPPPVPGAEPQSSGATVEFDTLAHRGDDDERRGATAGAEASDEDVLEETPEFLRETPEHDRLWFEQKPPRDFDLED